ncbi:MAG: glycosyltransferase family 39 protein [Caldilineaceae bacterium]
MRILSGSVGQWVSQSAKQPVGASANGDYVSGEREPFTLFRSPLPEIAIITLAAILRFWRLGYHSIWFDEAVSLRWAIQEGIDYMWPTTFRLVEEKHPPVYYTLLKIWHYLLTPFGLGMNDAALRALGSALGVLTVVGVLLLATRISGRATGLLAALLTTLSPVLVWYSQELRMFQPAATFLVWAAYCLLRAWQAELLRHRLLWWLGMVIALDLALYTYLFSAFMLPSAGLALVGFTMLRHRSAQVYELRFTRRDRLNSPRETTQEAGPLSPFPPFPPFPPSPFRRFTEGVIALGIMSLIFLPLALNALNVNADESTPGVAFANFWSNSRRLLKIFTIWRERWPDWVGEVAVWMLVGLLLIGLVGWKSVEEGRSRGVEGRGDWRDRVWLWVWIGGPLVVANVMLSRSHSIFKEERYLIFMAPFVLWAIARGVVVIGARWRVAGWTAGAAVVIMLAAMLPRLWTPGAYRENWRAATTYIEQYEQMSQGLTGVGASGSAASAVVAHISYTHQPVDWYLKQRYAQAELPVFGLFGNPLTPEQVDSVIAPPLLGISKELGAATLWLTQSHLEGIDDERLVEGWLNAHYPLITEQYPAGVKLSGYALKTLYDALPPLADGAAAANVELTPGLTLAACEVTTPRVSAVDAQLHPPSGWVHVRLWWRATESIGQDFTATAQVVNAQGVWGERLPRPNGALERFPTSAWQVGQFVRDELDINLNPETPNGAYAVTIGLQDKNGVNLPRNTECGGVQIW